MVAATIRGRSQGAADVGPQLDDLPAALLQCHPRRPRLARAPPIVVVIIAGRYPMPAAAAVVALERDDVAAPAAPASPHASSPLKKKHRMPPSPHTKQPHPPRRRRPPTLPRLPALPAPHPQTSA